MDVAKTMGMGVGEAAKLSATLQITSCQSAEQTKNFIKQAGLLARQSKVAPKKVLAGGLLNIIKHNRAPNKINNK